MSSQRNVNSLGLAPHDADVLRRHGFTVAADLQGMTPIELSKEIGCTPSAALSMIRAAQMTESVITPAPSEFLTNNSEFSNDLNINDSLDPYTPPSKLSALSGAITAKDLLSTIANHRPVITYVRTIDQMLGGGVFPGQLTEFCGVPGIGKTQLSTQLSLNVQIPEQFSGCGGEAIYIDTEGSFVPERAYEMATHLSTHLLRIAKASLRKNPSSSSSSTTSIQLEIANEFTPEKILNGIHVFRCHDQTELLATLNRIPILLRDRINNPNSIENINRKPVKLVIIDSVAFHFRQDVFDISTRSRSLAQIASQLTTLANEFNLAVVSINHVTTKVLRNPTGNSSKLVAALGEQWSHCVTNRVMLYWAPDVPSTEDEDTVTEAVAHVPGGQYRRMASLVKSASMPSTTVSFLVDERGVRDIRPPANDSKRPRIT